MSMTSKLPQGWVECELKDLCKVISKGTTPKNQTEEPNFARFLKAENVTKESILDLTSCKYIDEETHTKILKRSILKRNDILITIAGTLGRCAIVETDENLNTNQAVCFARLLNCGINPNFIKYFILSPFVNRKLTNKAKVTAIPNLTLEIIKNINIKLPPLNEQKRIVEKIEEEFGKIDEGIEKLKLAQEQIKQYRQSVLKSAFDGKLYKTTEWEENNITNICELKSGNTIDKSLEEENGEIPYVKVGDMNIPDNIEEIITSSRFVNLCDIKEDSLIPIGAIIFPKRGGAIATNKKRKVIKPIIIDLNTMAIIPKGNILSELLYYFMIKLDLSKISNGGAVPQINHYSFENIKINLPTINEQKQIVREIEKRFEVADEVERVIAENLEKAEQLKQSILKKAFEGRLVPQDPTDEPASELLTKIKAERNK